MLNEYDLKRLSMAQFMRDVQKPNFRIKLMTRYGRVVEEQSKFGGWRTVKEVKSRSVILYNENTGTISQLDTYPASLMSYCEVGPKRYLYVYGKGKRPAEQGECSATLKGDESFDYSTGMVWTPKVKGNLELAYEIEFR